MYIGGCKIDAAYLGSCKLDKLYLGMCEVYSSGPALPKWQAFVADPETGEMTGLIDGVGDATNARTAPINLRTHEDLYAQQDDLKVGYRGGRTVRNFWKESETLNYQGSTFGCTWTANSVDFSIANNDAYFRATRYDSQIFFGDGSDAIATIKILPGSVGAGTVAFRPYFDGYPAVIFTPEEITEPVVLSVTGKIIIGGGSPAATLTLDNRTVVGASGTFTGVVYVEYLQLERISGTIPSEYVQAGANPVSKVFATENGNSVDGNGVVTFAKGADLPEVPLAARFPQVTNDIIYSRDYSGAGWTKDAIVTPSSIIGVDGALAAANVEDDNATPSAPEYTTGGVPIVNPGETKACVVFIKKDITHDSICKIDFLNTGTTVSISVNLEPATGVATLSSNTLGAEWVVDEIDEFYRVVFFATDPDTGNTQWQMTFYPYYDTGAESVGADACHIFDADSLDHALELVEAPIYTEAAEVTRDRDDIQLDSSNHDDTEGTYYLEADLTGVCHILGDFLSFDGTLIALTDGTNATSLFNGAGVHQIGCVYGAGKMRLNVDGVWSTEVDYDGTLLSGAFDIGRDSDWPVYVRNFLAWGTKDESLIDGLMV